MHADTDAFTDTHIHTHTYLYTSRCTDTGTNPHYKHARIIHIDTLCYAEKTHSETLTHLDRHELTDSRTDTHSYTETHMPFPEIDTQLKAGLAHTG